MLKLCRFCLEFSEFGYVTTIFYFPNFFYVSKKYRKSLGKSGFLEENVRKDKITGANDVYRNRYIAIKKNDFGVEPKKKSDHKNLQ